LIEHASVLGIRPKLILLNDAYNSAEVINYLNGIGVKYIIRTAQPIEGTRHAYAARLSESGNLVTSLTSLTSRRAE